MAANTLPVVPAVVIGTYTMGLGVIRALGKQGIPVIAVYYDRRDMGNHSRYAVEKIKAPHPGEHEPDFIALLEDVGSRYPNSVLFPTSDASLVAISRNKSCLESHFRIASTEWEITQRFIEKKHTYALAEAAGVPIPKTIVPKCLEDVKTYASTAMYPCLVKPNQSHIYKALFHRKMALVKNDRELIDAYSFAEQAAVEVILQEFIPGPDSLGANYNAYFIDSEPVVEFTAQKIRGAPPSTGSPCLVISARIPEIIEPGRKILQAVGFYGFACTEFKKDPRDGVYKLMEVNGRHNLSGLLAVRAGINFPYLHYRHLAYGDLPTGNNYRTGIAWIDLTRDLYFGMKQWAEDPGSIRGFFDPYRRSRTYAILDFKDPLPFAKRLLNFITSTISKNHTK